jgi:multidrug efflux pump subunit AcrB
LSITTTGADTLLLGFTWEGAGAIQLDLLHRLAKDLQQKLSALGGTKKVDLYGEPEEEIVVTLDSATMVGADITAAEVSSAIVSADAKVSAGRLQNGRTDLIIELSGELDSVNRIRNIPVRQGDDGHFLRIGDVASVEKKPREPTQTKTIIRGKPAIILTAQMENQQRVDRWAASARKVVGRFQATLPAGVSVGILFDQRIHTDERLGDLTQNLLLGAAVVVIILFFMMGLKSALLVASALPLTLLMVLPVLNVLEVPLHQISLTGLIIALGLLIDNAIVAIDDYSQARVSGLDRAASISVTVRHLFIPLAASTVTTTLTFLPLILLPGNIGEFVGALGISVILSVVFSLVLSLTILPALAAYFDRTQVTAVRQCFLQRGFSHDGLRRLYRKVIAMTVRWPWVGIVTALAIPLAGFGVAPQLVEQFFPPVDRNQFQIQLKLPDHVALEETSRAVEKARAILLAHSEVLDSTWFIGERPPRVYYNVTISEDGSASYAAGFVNTRSPEATHALLPALQKEMAAAFPDAVVLTMPYAQGPPVEAPIELFLYGPDLAELQRLGEHLRLILSETRSVTYTRATIIGGRPKLVFVPDEDEASLAGFNLVDLATQLNSNLDGIVGGTVLERTEELPVRVRMAHADRADLGRIVTSTVRAPKQGGTSREGNISGVPLNVIAHPSLTPATNLITRRNGERLNIVHAFVEPFSLPGEALAGFRRHLAQSDFQLPAGYRLQYGGETEGSGEARAGLISVFLPLMVLMVSTVVLAFNSFRYAAVIDLVAVLSIGGALLTLWIFDLPMGFMAVVGTMGLIGLAINDSIVLLSALKADSRAREADDSAICDVVVGASRHIIATTLTTIGGFLPLILWGGTFWPPLAIAVAGGMIGATLLALFFVPPMFAVIARRDHAKAIRRLGAENHAPAHV